MPKMKSKSKRKARAQKPRNEAVYDLLAFMAFFLGVFVLLSLMSYDPMDPSMNTTVKGHVIIENYGGIVGSYLADFCMQVFGYVGYFLPFVLFGLTAALVFRPEVQHFSVRILGFGLFLASLSLLLAIVEGENIGSPAWGGAVGFLGRKLLIPYLGEVGLSLVSLLFLALSLVLGADLTFKLFLRNFFFLLKQPMRLGAFLAPRLGSVRAFVGQILAKEEKNIEVSMDEIRSHEPPKIPIQELEHKPTRKVITEPEISIREKADKKLEKQMPSFHTMDFKEEKTGGLFGSSSREKKSYKLPPEDLLEEREGGEIQVDRDLLFSNAQLLEQKLKDYGVFGKVVEVQPGPVVTMYEFEPAPGVKVNQITRLNEDLALALKANSVRITLIPGKAVIGVEVANRDREVVYLREILEDEAFRKSSSKLSLALGKDISGASYLTDLRRMPHLLVAGATGSGKSVSINTMILSMLYNARPDEVRMILVDPKMLELSLYDEIPHLLLPVVTDPRKASVALRWAVTEMERRYRLMADIGVRNIEGYNKKVLKAMEELSKKKPELIDRDEELSTIPPSEQRRDEHDGKLPFIIIVIDELADLMMVSGREVEESIVRLAQMARAAGVHLILATQRPSVDVITGVIKANMPARISFQVSSKIDSRTILDTNGAELLLGAGDMLYLPAGTSRLERIHGAFVSDAEVKAVTDFWKKQAKPDYDLDILKVQEEQDILADSGEDGDMYRQALNIVRSQQVASISLIQRKLRIGYNRAARLVEQMEEEGFLAQGEPGKPRQVIMSRFMDL